ncbi:ABC-2 family transporter protein [Vibrio mimicus]
MLSTILRYMQFSKAEVMISQKYKLSKMLLFLVDFMFIQIQIQIWVAIYKESATGSLVGTSLSEIIYYVFVSIILRRLINGFAFQFISDDFKSGRIVLSLLRPVSYPLYLFFRSLGMVFVNIMYVVLPLFVLVYCFYSDLFKSAFVPVHIILVVFVFAYLISFLIDFMFGLITFFTQNSFGLVRIKSVIERLFSGLLAPLYFFPDWFQNVCDFMPFKYVYYFPVILISKNVDSAFVYNGIMFQAMWLLVLFFIFLIFWNYSIKRITSFGG